MLAKVKEQLFKLWGDLEETKAKRLLSGKPTKSKPTTSFKAERSSPSLCRKAGDQPDLHSGSESENGRKGKKSSISKRKDHVLQERNSNTASNIYGIAELECCDKSNIALLPNNKPFLCCIRQYGVTLDEEDPTKANAGKGKRWQRVFGLFNTQIL